MSQKKNDTQKSLVNKLVEILDELGPIAKSKRNVHFGYNYVGEGQIMSELRHRLSTRGIFLFTSVESIVPHYSTVEKAGVYVCVQTKHTFVDAETNEQFVVGGGGLGWDSGDKGAYKAITGAVKYALMKNFLVTDEQDPEAGDQQQPSQPEKHTRHKPYEEKAAEGQKATEDLIELKAFLTENQIPDGFLLRLLQDKALIDGHTKNLAQLKPGVLRRCLSPKSKENLLKAWKAHQDETPAEKKEPPEKKDAKASKEAVRTKEGDQTTFEGRVPVQKEMSPKEVLEQEGYTDWRQVAIHFGDQKAAKLGGLSSKALLSWIKTFSPKAYKGSWDENDIILDAALCLAWDEMSGKEAKK